MSAIKNISLYIPHVFPNFTKEYVADAFESFGLIDRVDFVAKQDRNGKDYNAVYVHFKKWFDTAENHKFQTNLLSDYAESGPVRVYHDNLWYWIVLPNTANKHTPGDRKPRIDLGNAKAISTSSSSHVTPVKEQAKKSCPDAPKKRSYADVATSDKMQAELEHSKHRLIDDFDQVADFQAEIEAEMDEIEELLEEEDQNLIRIDGRYVQELEAENWGLRAEIAQLRAALINLDQMYQAEAAKVRAFGGVEL